MCVCVGGGLEGLVLVGRGVGVGGLEGLMCVCVCVGGGGLEGLVFGVEELVLGG